MKNVYDDTASEYEALRKSCGLLDYDGAGLLRINGPGASAFTSQVTTRSVDFLLEGQVSASLLLRDDGTILADTLVHCEGSDYRLEIPQAQAEQTRKHLLKAVEAADDVELEDLGENTRVYGIEGPGSFKLAQHFLDFPVSSMSYSSHASVTWNGETILVSRTGVTGEYGYKFHVPVALAEQLRDQLVELGATRVGADALDICRMEARFADVDVESGGQALTPFELGIQWMVNFEHDFVGKAALLESWQAGQQRHPVCWRAEGDGTTPTSGSPVTIGEDSVGVVGHAVHSPALGCLIGTARVDSAVAAAGLEMRITEPAHDVRTVSGPFLVPTSFSIPLE